MNVLPPRRHRFLIAACWALLAAPALAAIVNVTPADAAAQIAAAEPGDEVRFAAGSYELNSMWSVRAGVTLAGGEGVTIQLVGGDAVLVPGGDMILRGLTFRTSGAQDAPLIAINGSTLQIDGCTFQSFGGGRIVDAAGAAVTITDSRFIECPGAIAITGTEEQPASLAVTGSTFSAPVAALPSFVRAAGNTTVNFSGMVQGGGRAIVLDRVSAPATIHDCTFSGSRISALAVLEPAAEVVIENCEVKGSFGAGAFHVTGGAGSGGAGVTIAGIRGKDLGVTGDGFGLLTIVQPDSLGSITLKDLSLAGTRGTAIRLVSPLDVDGPGVEVTAREMTISGWDCGIDASAGGGAAISLSISGAFSDCGMALRGLGTGLSVAASEPFHVLRGRDGIVLDGQAGATIDKGLFELAAGSAVRAGRGARLQVTGSSFTGCGVGVHVMAGAGAVDLGTDQRAGDNTFRVDELAQFAIRNESGTGFSSIGNKWLYGELECFGRTAIDDMIDDGDEDNPLGETGSGPVELDINSNYEGDVLAWDLKAGRRNRGYGNSVFRSIDDVEPRIGNARELALGAGSYELPGLPDRAFIVSGRSNVDTTIVVRDTDGVFAGRRAPLTIRDVALAPPADTVPPGIVWSGADLHLIHVDVLGFARPLFSASPGDAEITVSYSRFEESEASAPDESVPSFTVIERPLLLDDVRVKARGPVFVWSQGATNHMLESRQLHIEQLDRQDGAAVTVHGSAELAETTIYQAGGTALELHPEGGETPVVIDGLEAEGFDVAAIDIRDGLFASIEISGAELTPSEEASGRATGLWFRSGASAPLVVSELHGTDLRPGMLLEGEWTGGRIDGVGLELSTEFNAIDREETGVNLSFRSSSAESIELLGLEISGYDNGLFFTKSVDCASTITLGNTMATGANRLTRNGVGMRIASSGARVVMREDRNRSEFSANGVAILVEDGTLRMDNVRLLNNQAGVIVRGGTVDLGGGPLGGLGGNLLWPQAGAFAVINESKDTIFALQNRWGDATALLYTDAAPVSDTRNNPEVGPVLLVNSAQFTVHSAQPGKNSDASTLGEN